MNGLIALKGFRETDVILSSIHADWFYVYAYWFSIYIFLMQLNISE